MCKHQAYSNLLDNDLLHSEKPTKPTKKAKGNQAQAVSGLIPGWDSTYKALSGARKEVAGPLDGDDSMVRYGGMVDDEEKDDLERVAAISGKSNKKGTLVCRSSLTMFFVI